MHNSKEESKIAFEEPKKVRGVITNQIIERLKETGIKAKKSLGQNFLVNEGIYQKIVESAAIEPADIIVEVGPGLGILTDILADKAEKVIAVEKDRQLADYLNEHFSNNKNVTIINEDILKFKIENLKLKIGTYKVIGNIPYYLTSRLIRQTLASWPSPKSIIFTVQKEVAQRITAVPPKMSLLSVAVQFYAQALIETRVSRGSFYPAPKVDSAVIKIIPSRPRPDEEYAKNFFKVVHAGFSSKRKQLANNLATGLKIPKDKIQDQLMALGINPKRRAETLTIKEWHKILDKLLLPF